MKTLVLALTLAVAVALPASLPAQGAAAVVAKQRAQELRDQNNVRQGVPSPAAPVVSAPATGGATAPAGGGAATLKPLESALRALTGQPTVNASAKEALVQQLLAAARGPQKPPRSAVQGLVDSLAACLSGATLEESELQRLATNLFALMNAATVSQDRLRQILDDVQAILQVGGVRRAQAVGVTGQLRQIVQSLQQPATP